MLAPDELLVHDEHDTCPYLPGQIARLPLRWPVGGLTPEQFDAALDAGDRRSGPFLYRPKCPACNACQALRIDVAAFRPTATHRRVKNRGDRELETRIGPPRGDARRVELYNRHKNGRGLVADDEERRINAEGYRSFLVETCCHTLEFAYYLANDLIAVAVADRGASALSAVYCCFDPAHGRLSPGTYSILKQLEYCRQQGLRYLYLGLYVEGCGPMEYKTTFHPHERLIAGHWRRFE
jgi:arginine-tRNA-protein transferase